MDIEIAFGMDVHMRGGDSFEEKKFIRMAIENKEQFVALFLSSTYNAMQPGAIQFDASNGSKVNVSRSRSLVKLHFILCHFISFLC